MENVRRPERCQTLTGRKKKKKITLLKINEAQESSSLFCLHCQKVGQLSFSLALHGAPPSAQQPVMAMRFDRTDIDER